MYKTITNTEPNYNSERGAGKPSHFIMLTREDGGMSTFQYHSFSLPSKQINHSI